LRWPIGVFALGMGVIVSMAESTANALRG